MASLYNDSTLSFSASAPTCHDVDFPMSQTGHMRCGPACPVVFLSLPPLACVSQFRAMSQQPVGSTSWRRRDPSSNADDAGLASLRLGRPFGTHAGRSDRDNASPTMSRKRLGSESRSGYKRTRRSKARLTRAVAADAQTSLNLDASLVATSFARTSNGAGVTSSLTSPNNFINFCDTVAPTPITDGKQISGGSCNPAPMGLIPSTDHIPSVLIYKPANMETVAANTAIDLQILVSNLKTGVSVNPATNYLSAPQQLDPNGNVVGHYHLVVEKLVALNSTVPMDPGAVTFFSIINKEANAGGAIQSSIPNGLPEGFYRATVTTHAANHQPVLVPVSQHGSLNDVTYFTVTANGKRGSIPSIKRRAPIRKTVPRRRPFTAAPREVGDQSSLSLSPSVIAKGFSNNGQDSSVAGQSASLTSVNNFINFCATSTLPVTNGTKLATGFCNPAPMGVLPSSAHMPTSKFTYPRNGEILAPDSPMTIGLAVTNLAMGNSADLTTSFLAAPQQLDANGNIRGRAFIVVEQLSASMFAPTDPKLFKLFTGVNALPDSTGVVTTTISGLSTGFYRVSSIITATNGQPVLLPVLQHGAVNDAIYITVANGGALPSNQTALPLLPTAVPPATSSSGAASASSSVTTPLKDVSSTPSTKTNVAGAVSGALVGITVIALLLLGLWFFLRRRSRARAAMMSHPVILSGSDFGDAPVRQVPVHLPPSAFYGVKRGGIGELPLSGRRTSTDSAAPSYHTQVSSSEWK
ncbi:hypothetical protein B0H15DRAFT_297476 [Mycena belliarum]|uniref:Uncharacterized protein n=1 Tax=Mycena belliarum TaxID=1033014 RepID=A0AAD6U792_9AGAR|nr:hypothetical protein B0H15DRAFT_297476 [Mycena belliae]